PSSRRLLWGKDWKSMVIWRRRCRLHQAARPPFPRVGQEPENNRAGIQLDLPEGEGHGLGRVPEDGRGVTQATYGRKLHPPQVASGGAAYLTAVTLVRHPEGAAGATLDTEQHHAVGGLGPALR